MGLVTRRRVLSGVVLVTLTGLLWAYQRLLPIIHASRPTADAQPTAGLVTVVSLGRASDASVASTHAQPLGRATQQHLSSSAAPMFDAAPKPKEVMLIPHEGASGASSVFGVATASVRGNLGPPSSVLTDAVDNWLTDRWQVAGDMSGTPLPLPQWIQIDFMRSVDGVSTPAHVCVDHVLLDWETAFASEYTLEMQDGVSPTWHAIFFEHAGLAGGPSDKHVLHAITPSQLQQSAASSLASDADDASRPCGTSIRLKIIRNGAAWGASLWRFQVFGVTN